ncbi:hypothetical protein C2G38_2136555 [Gigaspora rosea]|uniref:Uncharacterized protein n=1 Tax=Gigaspora rosea TaxID=44941 RepID=A0A397WCV9_9GLOM|nr:hypothetical protein C2G38_2136555 [Gigaspora rosea]
MYKKRMLKVYPYLEVGKQLCHPHYCKVVEADRNQRRRKKKIYNREKNSETIIPVSNNNTEEPTFASYIDILTKALYHIQRRDGASLELDPVKFERFFNYIMNAIIPKERSAYNINESKKSIVGLCYMLADRQSYKISQGLIINTFDPIEMLTIHSYAYNIVERKEERSMRGLQLVGFREQHLHSTYFIIMGKAFQFSQKNYRECQENKPTKKSAPKNSTNKTSTKKTSTKKTPTKASAKASKKKPPEIYQLATLNEEVDL